MFEIDFSDNAGEGLLCYYPNNHEFRSIPNEESDIIFSIAYLYLGFSSVDNKSTQIWGYHNNTTWIDSSLYLPKARNGKLKITSLHIEGGDSIRLKQSDNWVTLFDNKKSIVYFGDTGNFQNIQYVKIFPGTIIGLNLDGDIIEIWLHPRTYLNNDKYIE